jgi:hypothetical protein
MEYIDGLDMKTYIVNYGINGLYDFITTTIQQFKIDAKPDENTITATLTYNYLNNPVETVSINL